MIKCELCSNNKNYYLNYDSNIVSFVSFKNIINSELDQYKISSEIELQ